MDLSSLTESQQQQLQQLHQQFQQHQQEQQQQQQQQQQQVQSYDPSHAQAYDPSQAQPYDQSNQSYYPYHQYQQQQHYHPYYQPDYTNTYQQTQPTQNDSAPIQPPGISVAPEAEAPQQGQHQQNSFYPVPAAAEQQPNSSGSSSYPVPSGLNPAAAAAVAALSQLTQFAGNMDAAERAMAGLHERQWPGKNGGYGPGGPMQLPPHMPPHGGYHHQGPFPGHRGGTPYRGGGRRGGGPFRGGGGGRGNFGQRPPRTDGSSPQFHGRGRGRGGNRRFPQRATSSHPEIVPTGEPASASEHGDVEGETPVSAPSATAPGQAPPRGRASSTRRQPQIAWCELCRVDCTSLDILEQHKNGKKHKKNLQRFEELQKAGHHMPMTVTNSAPAPVPLVSADPTPIPTSAPAPIAVSPPIPGSIPSLTSSSVSEVTTTLMPEVQNQPLSESKSEVIARDENVEETKAPDNMSTEVINNESKLKSEQQNDNVEHAEVEGGEPTEGLGKKRRFDRFDTRKRGMNRKMRGGRGAKRIRTFDRPTRMMEPPKPKEVSPIICDLCNVKCDTPAVFETHLAGRKHISKLKRFEGHQAMYGPLGLQALYPPNPNTQPIFIPPAHQQTMYPPQGSYRSAAASYVPPPHTHPTATVSEPHVPSDGNQNSVAPESEGQQGAVVGQEADGIAVGIPSETPVLPPQENNIVTVSEHVAPAKDDGVTVADYGATVLSENATFSGLDTKMVDVTGKNSVMVSEHVAPAKDDGVTVTDYGAMALSENATFSGLDTKMFDATAKNSVMVSEHVAPVKDEVIAVADYGVATSSENVTFPGIDTKMVDATAKTEESA